MTQNGNTKILVVEDDQSLAELYAEWLADRYVVETAYSGEEALEAFDSTVDLVLLDRMMPGLSGGEVLTRLRQYESNCQVAIVSAVTPDFDIVKMGFDAYLEKPVEAADLEDVISQMLTRGEYNEDLQELFSLIERQSTLEAVMDADTLETSPKYQSLTDQITELEDKVERYLQNLPDQDFRVAIERLQRTAAERREQQQYQSLTEDVLDTSQEGVVVVDRDGQVVWANETTEELLGVDRDDIQGSDYSRIASESYQEYTSGEQTLSDLVTHSLENMNSKVEAIVRIPETASKEQQWLEYWSGPIQTGLYAGGRIEHYHNITERYAYEQQLEDLHAVSRDLMTADSERSIGETVANAAVGELGFEFAAIYTREENTGRLAPIAHSSMEDVAEIELPTISEGDTPVWTTYVTRTEQLAPEDVADTRSRQWLTEEFSSWRLYSLEKGVLLVGMTTTPEIPSRKNKLAKTLAANAASSFERAAQETALRERDQRLNEQNERLTRLDRINTLIRSISATVISANTRDELEQEVCNALAHLDLVSGAWIGKKDINTNTIEVRAKTKSLTYQKVGAEDNTADDNTQRRNSTLPPAERAYRIEDSVVEGDLMTARSETEWEQDALKNGVNSIVAVPLQSESSILGVLEVHSKLPNAFAEEEVTALTELGQIIGHGISALRQRVALLSGGGTILKVQFKDDTGLATLVSDENTDLEVLNVLTDSPHNLLFARLTGGNVTPEAFETAGFDPETVILSNSRNGIHCKIPIRNSSLCEKLTDQGVAINQITEASESNEMVVSVTVPFTVDVGRYLSSLREDYSDLTLLSKLDSERGETNTSLSARLDGALTARQEEVLQTALYAGYFNWPRDADSTSIAKTLDIAQSTFNQHLRAAESNLLTTLYGDTTEP
ncbi:helix-turn-helix domain-containing protein [Halorubrum sp. N11]|uniref:helix-turn-helix domain-containing protein n=1 Tax=Halorubrum sp. N11 TaxID=3402276 RepID=UPI003EC0BA7D